MPTTPPFAPSKALIDLDAARTTVDPALYLVGILRSEWGPQSTDGTRPNVDLAEVHKAVIFRDGDWITVYPVTEVSEPVTITYGFTNHTYALALDMLTARDRPHLVKMVEEAQRVIHAHRKDTFEPPGTSLTGRQWLQMVRYSPYEKTLRGFYRRVIEVQVNWRYRAIDP